VNGGDRIGWREKGGEGGGMGKGVKENEIGREGE